jgi:hypothetical protein
MWWPFSAFMQPKGMLSTKELKVGETYKQLSHRHATGFDACKTLTRKQHLTDGKYYKLTFHNGKRAAGSFTTPQTSQSSNGARRVIVVVIVIVIVIVLDEGSSRNTRYDCILLYPFRTMCFKQFAMNVRHGSVVRCSF